MSKPFLIIFSYNFTFNFVFFSFCFCYYKGEKGKFASRKTDKVFQKNFYKNWECGGKNESERFESTIIKKSVGNQ